MSDMRLFLFAAYRDRYLYLYSIKKQNSVMRILQLSFVLCLLMTLSLNMQAQCPGCIISVPTWVPADTAWLGPIPDGTKNVYYEEDLSFRLPKTSDGILALSPDIPPGITFNDIEIVGITNLPPGISYELDNPSGVYDPQVQSDGCARLCGTPIVADSFSLTITARATVFGISQSVGFNVPFKVNQPVSTNTGFSTINGDGCEDLEVSFVNNIPSNGNPGITYNWDFGNTLSSTNENPGSVVYTTPGSYVVNYTATIDTVGYILTNVTVAASDCNDDVIVPLAPDFIIKIFDPSGNEIYNSGASITDTYPPVGFGVSIPIGPGSYSVEVIDDDGILPDDNCGSVNFTQLTNGNVSSGPLTVSFTIVNPVDIITSTDTIDVYPSVSAPTISAPTTTLCAGDTTTFMSSYATGNQWYFDSTAIPGANGQMLQVADPGEYYVIYTSPDGCSGTSMIETLTVNPLPPAPGYGYFQNEAAIFDVSTWPASYTLEWYLDGVQVPGSTNELLLCLTTSGTLEAVLTDNVTLCVNSYSFPVTYDPAIDCTVSADFVNELQASLDVFPNPAQDQVELSFLLEESSDVTIEIVNLLGQTVSTTQLLNANGQINQTINLENASSGLYIVHVVAQGKHASSKLVIE